MQLARLSIQGIPNLCLIDNNQFLSTSSIDTCPSHDLCDFLAKSDWKHTLKQAEKCPDWRPLPSTMINRARSDTNHDPEVSWLPCISEKSRIFCVGKNYADHAREMTSGNSTCFSAS